MVEHAVFPLCEIDEEKGELEKKESRESYEDVGHQSESDTAASYDGETEQRADFIEPLRLTKSGRKRATPFPVKLMKVLSKKENVDIVSWTPSGKAFLILKPKVFCSQVLNDEFKSAKYSSFTRKLQRWGFKRHYKGDDAGAFYHKHFQKGRTDLVEKMSCYKPMSACKEMFSTPEVSEPSHLQAPAPADVEPGSCPSNSSQMLLGNGNNTSAFANMVFQPGQIIERGLQHQLEGQPQVPILMDYRPDLEATLDCEVTRLLRERINAAALCCPSTMKMTQQEIGGLIASSCIHPDDPNLNNRAIGLNLFANPFPNLGTTISQPYQQLEGIPTLGPGSPLEQIQRQYGFYNNIHTQYSYANGATSPL